MVFYKKVLNNEVEHQPFVSLLDYILDRPAGAVQVFQSALHEEASPHHPAEGLGPVSGLAGSDGKHDPAGCLGGPSSPETSVCFLMLPG